MGRDGVKYVFVIAYLYLNLPYLYLRITIFRSFFRQDVNFHLMICDYVDVRNKTLTKCHFPFIMVVFADWWSEIDWF